MNKKNKKNFYEEWKKKYRIDDADSDGETGGGGGGGERRPARGQGHGRGRGRGHGRPGLNPKSPNHQKAAGPPNQTPGGRRIRSELKTKDQILKQRRKQQKQQFLQGGGMKKLRTKNKRFLSDMKKSGFGRGGQKKGKMRKRL